MHDYIDGDEDKIYPFKIFTGVHGILKFPGSNSPEYLFNEEKEKPIPEILYKIVVPQDSAKESFVIIGSNGHFMERKDFISKYCGEEMPQSPFQIPNVRDGPQGGGDIVFSKIANFYKKVGEMEGAALPPKIIKAPIDSRSGEMLNLIRPMLRFSI